MSKSSNKDEGSKTWLFVAVVAAAAALLALNKQYEHAGLVAAGGVVAWLYVLVLKERLDLDWKDIVQIVAGIALGVYGLTKATALEYPYHQALLTGYWLALAFTAHLEHDNPGEVLWYAVICGATLGLKDFLSFVVQDDFDGTVVLSVGPMIKYIYPPAIVAPLVYNFGIQPVSTHFLEAWEKRKRAKKHVLSDVLADTRKTLEVSKTVVTGTAQRVATKTQTLRAVKPDRPERPKREGGKPSSPKFWQRKGNGKTPPVPGDGRPDQRAREMSPVGDSRDRDRG